MARYIKSHSNYVLSSKHQQVADGTVFERDITTIGGVDSFSKGQTPIYKSNNFIITVRNNGSMGKQYDETSWKENSESGTTWTMSSLESIKEKFEDLDDTKIVLKQDYYDLRDFAYYGSLTELFRASVTDVVRRFPGELYFTSDLVYYTSSITEDFQTVTDTMVLGLGCGSSDEESAPREVSNPFGIDMHSFSKPIDGEELKFFADGGNKNYTIFKDGEEPQDITELEVRAFVVVTKSSCVCDAEFGSDLFYSEWLRPNVLLEYFNRKDVNGKEEDRVWWKQRNYKLEKAQDGTETITDEITEEGKEDYEELVRRFSSGDIHEKYLEYYNSRFHVSKDGVDITPSTQGYPTQEKAYERIRQEQEAWREANPDKPSSEMPRWEQTPTYNPCGSMSCYFPNGVCNGSKLGSININGSYAIEMWIGDNQQLYYLADKEFEGVHIRPKEEFIAKFYNECDAFEKLLMNDKTTPKYKATFSVINENDMGYYRELQDFIFPTMKGGYNIDTTSYGFSNYTMKMVKVGEFYDERFSDNLYRSLTHEAIKNFDWSYTREYAEGDEEEYVVGGERMKKALRVFAREFDEVIAYAENIKSMGRVTYDERSNLPDYFLVDAVEECGWDVKLVLPYSLTLVDDEGYILEYKDEDLSEGGENCDGQLNNKIGDEAIGRLFEPITTATTKPYTVGMINDGTDNGYFMVCCEDNIAEFSAVVPPIGACDTSAEIKFTKSGGDENAYIKLQVPCWYKDCEFNEEEFPYTFIKAKDKDTYYDKCALGNKGVLKNKIKSFTDEREYTYQEANNEFLRRLKINSPYIWRHKGTVEGIEMLLGFFGMKSRRWVENHPSSVIDCEYSMGEGDSKAIQWDYEIIEYTSFSKRIEETWDPIHQDYRIKWLNSTKAVNYDNRTLSNYTSDGANEGMLPYQGITVAYRNEYENRDGEKYKDVEDKVKCFIAFDGTSTDDESVGVFRDANNGNKPVVRRYLYPFFNKDEEIDGNPYFQMDGGWLHKKIIGENGEYNFQFDKNDNIVYSDYIKGSEEEKDNEFIHKETVRNIRRVNNIGELFTIPMNELYDGAVCFVTNIEKDSVIIDGQLFPISHEYKSVEVAEGEEGPNGVVLDYVQLIKADGYIRIGQNKFFDTSIIVLNRDGQETIYGLDDKPDGYEVKAYIHDGRFVCKEDFNGSYSIESFTKLDDMLSENGTNYFVIDDVEFSDRLATYEIEESEGTEEPKGLWSNGWRRLSTTDKEFLKVNTITNYFRGNNPHNGRMVYDGGHEYFTYFKRLFKDSYDNDKFDERCYEDYFYTADNEINEIGFKGLIHENDDIVQYDANLNVDEKVHYFGNYKRKTDEPNGDAEGIGADECENKWDSDKARDGELKNVYIYGENPYREVDFKDVYKKESEESEDKDFVKKYIMSDEDKFIGGFSGYTSEHVNEFPFMDKETDVDESTSQIVNNKRITIRFRLHNIWYTTEGQKELKFIDSIVTNYMEQMLPSTVIVGIEYDLTDYIPIDASEDGEWKTDGDGNEYYSKTITFDTNCDGDDRVVGSVSFNGTTVQVIQKAATDSDLCCDNCDDLEINEVKECTCDNIEFTEAACDCSSLNLSKTSVNLNENGNKVDVTYYVVGCESENDKKVTVRTEYDWIGVMLTGNNTIAVSAYENEGDKREGDIKVYLGSIAEPCKTIHVTQDAKKVVPPSCSCDDVTVTDEGDKEPEKTCGCDNVTIFDEGE